MVLVNRPLPERRVCVEPGMLRRNKYIALHKTLRYMTVIH